MKHELPKNHTIFKSYVYLQHFLRFYSFPFHPSEERFCHWTALIILNICKLTHFHAHVRPQSRSFNEMFVSTFVQFFSCFPIVSSFLWLFVPFLRFLTFCGTSFTNKIIHNKWINVKSSVSESCNSESMEAAIFDRYRLRPLKSHKRSLSNMVRLMFQ